MQQLSNQQVQQVNGGSFFIGDGGLGIVLGGFAGYKGRHFEAVRDIYGSAGALTWAASFAYSAMQSPDLNTVPLILGSAVVGAVAGKMVSHIEVDVGFIAGKFLANS